MKVRFLRTVGFEGTAYTLGEVYDLPEAKVKALGDSVVVVQERSAPTPKAVDAAPVNKQVEAPAKKK